ncbi:hypothetical protein [Tolypothrix sp. NIES-4075]|uniref:hypothetical protein n=1 Tax=Tolypothrix sp. NIES-4075 TaxID=2005459 RepID=UPI001F245CB0|nr:hypothetical protein [Tolypothrix sp. NIES-4075]
MSGLYEVLQKIKAKPGMYIGSASVSDLFMFVVGYEFARGELEIESTEWEDNFHENFQPWLQQKYHVSTSNSWAKIIMLYCVNEKEGFDSFFKLLDEFLARGNNLKSHKVDKNIVNATQIAFRGLNDEISKLQQEDSV